MNVSLSAPLDVNLFPTGRRLFALGQVATRAKAHDFPELAEHCGGAITHDRACLTLERRWEGLVAESKGKASSRTPPGEQAQVDGAHFDKPFAEWSQVFPHAACVVTLNNRLVHRAEIIDLDAESGPLSSLIRCI